MTLTAGAIRFRFLRFGVYALIAARCGRLRRARRLPRRPGLRGAAARRRRRCAGRRRARRAPRRGRAAAPRLALPGRVAGSGNRPPRGGVEEARWRAVHSSEGARRARASAATRAYEELVLDTTRGSRSARPTSSPATPPTPRTRPRTASSRRTARCGRFRPGAPFRPWLLEIVANEARNRRRSSGRRARARAARRRRGALGGRGPVPRGGRSSPPRGGERLLAALDALREDDRLVHRLPLLPRALRGRDGGRARHAAAGTVKSRLSRALDAAARRAGGGAGVTRASSCRALRARRARVPADARPRRAARAARARRAAAFAPPPLVLVVAVAAWRRDRRRRSPSRPRARRSSLLPPRGRPAIERVEGDRRRDEVRAVRLGRRTDLARRGASGAPASRCSCRSRGRSARPTSSSSARLARRRGLPSAAATVRLLAHGVPRRAGRRYVEKTRRPARPSVTSADVRGRPGLLARPAPRTRRLPRPRRPDRDDEPRPRGNVLLWEHGSRHCSASRAP